jgi:endonuclease III
LALYRRGIAAIAFGERAVVIDTNVARVVCLHGMTDLDSPDEIRELAGNNPAIAPATSPRR